MIEIQYLFIPLCICCLFVFVYYIKQQCSTPNSLHFQQNRKSPQPLLSHQQSLPAMTASCSNSLKSQFSSPHGFCLGISDEIIIADTNNHRICVYDKNGVCKQMFGNPGKDEGQLWYPRKVNIYHVILVLITIHTCQ